MGDVAGRVETEELPKGQRTLALAMGMACPQSLCLWTYEKKVPTKNKDVGEERVVAKGKKRVIFIY